jgi:hypothetical protein
MHFSPQVKIKVFYSLGSFRKWRPQSLHQIQFPRPCVFQLFRVPDDEHNPETQRC